jgi:hypothetical protein
LCSSLTVPGARSEDPVLWSSLMAGEVVGSEQLQLCLLWMAGGQQAEKHPTLTEDNDKIHRSNCWDTG